MAKRKLWGVFVRDGEVEHHRLVLMIEIVAVEHVGWVPEKGCKKSTEPRDQDRAQEGLHQREERDTQIARDLGYARRLIQRLKGRRRTYKLTDRM